jgi:IS5 family transposase
MVFMDKLYDTKKSDQILLANGCAVGTIRKNNNKNKNFDLDKWRSKARMPFESVFSKLRKRTRYRGKLKVLFENFGLAMCYNLKKAIAIPIQNGA